MPLNMVKDIERREQLELGFDCPDSLGIRQRTSIIHSNVTYPNRRSTIAHEPIYSEIEEDSIHVTESPVFDNKTGVESTCTASGVGVDLEVLYAKVNKSPKKKSTSIPLGQFLHDSLQKAHKTSIKQLPTLPEPSVSNVSYSSPPLETSIQHTDYDSPTTSLMHCQSLNNIRVMEHNSPPNHNRNLSKSELSLQRSEMFLENLCRSEFIVEDGTLERLEKVENLSSRRESDSISYDIPNEPNNNDGVIKNLGLTSSPASPQKFLTKPFLHSNATQTEETFLSNQYESHCSSCPVTPHKYTKSKQQLMQSNSQPNSLNNTVATESGVTSSARARFKRLKQVLRNSLRKSKDFIKTRRASLPLNITQQIVEQTIPDITTQTVDACLNLETLSAIDEQASVTEQIARAVSICRQLPELETTREMVEAERLLLFTTLRYDSSRQLKYEKLTRNITQEGLRRDFSIDAMRFPATLETNLNDFYNYYFTVTFEVDGHIFSTQSTECRHGEVVFRNCNIDFNAQKHKNDVEPTIQCNVFMLRLRKITTLTCDLKDTSDMSSDIAPLTSTPASSMSSLNGIASRFRLYGSFVLDAQTFKPFVLSEESTNKPDLICLHASSTGNVPLKLCSKRQNMDRTISIDTHVKAYFTKTTYSGFLHVQDPFSLHNWNRRWCNLNGLELEVWNDMNSMNERPLFCLSLDKSEQILPLIGCTRELCARTRSFCFQCLISKSEQRAEVATVFFAAENDLDLSKWLQHLNETFNFLAGWMQ